MASPNFSRPRRPSEAQRAVNTLSVVSERDEDLPSQPRFSTDSERHGIRADGQGHGRSIRSQQLGMCDQRYPSTPSSGSRNANQIPDSLKRDGYSNPTMPIPRDTPLRDGEYSTAAIQRPGNSRKSSNSNTSTSASRPPGSSRSNSTSTVGSTKQPFVPKSILKVTTVEQTSERPYSRTDSTGGSSSGRSSDSGAVSYDASGKFVASDYDTSELSEKEIKKLQKKGINPALALEMKALRKGKSFGNLAGASYVS